MAAGFISLLTAGICQGSFGLGYKKYDPFSWPAFFGICNVLYIITATLFTWVFAPKLWDILLAQPLPYWAVPLLCGALWGLQP